MPSFPHFNHKDEGNMFNEKWHTDDAAASLNSNSVLQELLKIKAAVI
jgi:hypothetical protein